MSTNKQNTDDAAETTLSADQIRDFANAMMESQQALLQIAAKMDQHDLATVNAKNYKTGRKSLEHISKFVGAVNTAFIYRLGTRAEELSVAEAKTLFEKKRSSPKKSK